MNTTKISEVTKALKKAGYKEIAADEALTGIQPAKTYYRRKGALSINAGRVGFGIENARDARIFGKYHTTAIDDNGGAHEVATDWPELFFPRLFGILAGEMREEQIMTEICG